MVRVFVGLAKILLRFFIKKTSPNRTVIGLAFVFGSAGRSCGVNIHSWNGVMYCCHKLSPFVIYDLILIDRVIGSYITRCLIGIFLHFLNSPSFIL